MPRPAHDGLSKTGTSLLVCLAILSWCGCERSVVTTDYFPLRDGNRWEYRLLDHPRLKAMAAGQTVPTEPAVSTEPSSQEDSTTSPKAEVVNPGELSETKTDTAPARRVALFLKEDMDGLTFRATYDGYEQVWSKRGGYVGFQNQRGRHYLLILPPHTGYRWVVTDESGEDLYYEIENHSAIETPDGVFKECAVAREETRTKQEVTRYWFAPNVGLVRRSKFYAGEEVFRQELVAHEVRPARPEVRAAEDRAVQEALQGKNRGNEYRKRSDPKL
jgi:hypothetical protein